MRPSESESSAFTVPAELDGKTVAAVLRSAVDPGATWTQVRTRILRGEVRINGTLCLDDARRIKTDDVIELNARGAAPAAAEVRIVYLDTHLVVVDKPAGMETVRRPEERGWDARRKARQPTLDEATASALACGRRREPQEIRSVHRLDRDTSGLMLFALTAEAQQRLVRMFAAHEVARTYTAVVEGELDSDRMIQTHLTRDRGDGRRGSVNAARVTADAKHAVTHVHPIRFTTSGHTLVECRLETGRTHQIRIHLSEIGHPLSGERIYTRADATMRPNAPAAPRHALHSTSLAMKHPVTGQAMQWKSDWPPPDLQRWWARCDHAAQ